MRCRRRHCQSPFNLSRSISLDQSLSINLSRSISLDQSLSINLSRLHWRRTLHIVICDRSQVGKRGDKVDLALIPLRHHLSPVGSRGTSSAHTSSRVSAHSLAPTDDDPHARYAHRVSGRLWAASSQRGIANHHMPMGRGLL